MTRDEIVEFTKRLTDSGKLIEAGFQGLVLATLPPDTSQQQLEQMRMAFFAGAQHLFGTVMSIMGEESSEDEAKDSHRLSLINNELNEFVEQFKARHLLGGTQGVPN